MDVLYFWRDHTGHEIDLLYEADNMTHAAEIKSGKTAGTMSLIYGGDSTQTRLGMNVVPWRKASGLFGKASSKKFVLTCPYVIPITTIPPLQNLY